MILRWILKTPNIISDIHLEEKLNNVSLLRLFYDLSSQRKIYLSSQSHLIHVIAFWHYLHEQQLYSENYEELIQLGWVEYLNQLEFFCFVFNCYFVTTLLLELYIFRLLAYLPAYLCGLYFIKLLIIGLLKLHFFIIIFKFIIVLYYIICLWLNYVKKNSFIPNTI